MLGAIFPTVFITMEPYLRITCSIIHQVKLIVILYRTEISVHE
jgi:hypothetical protein